MKWLDNVIGPRIPNSILHKERKRFRRPTIFLIGAAFLLLVSIFLPYWELKLHAPQYPEGLKAEIYVNHLEGDISEINGLNHYIGMRPLQEAAQLERRVSIYLITVMSLLVAGAIYIHSPWAAVLSLPAALYPLIFLGDLYYWMRNFGTNLDPKAPMSSSVDPFVPPILGDGKVGQFKVTAIWDFGLWIAILASLLIIVGLYYHRKAYKPFYEQYKQKGKIDADT